MTQPLVLDRSIDLKIPIDLNDGKNDSPTMIAIQSIPVSKRTDRPQKPKKTQEFKPIIQAGRNQQIHKRRNKPNLLKKHLT